jgi:hypothetical protein
MARKQKRPTTKQTDRTRSPWIDRITTAALGIVAVSVLYLIVFTPKWRVTGLQPQELDGRVVSVGPVEPGPAPPRDFYSLPCNRRIALRRLWSRYTKEAKPIGEIYTIADRSGWIPAKSWHAAAMALQKSQQRDPTIGSDRFPFPLQDPDDWPAFAFFQSADENNPTAIVVSEFTIGDDKGKSMKATSLNIEKRVCE